MHKGMCSAVQRPHGTTSYVRCCRMPSWVTTQVQCWQQFRQRHAAKLQSSLHRWAHHPFASSAMLVSAALFPYTPAYVRHDHTIRAKRIAGFVQHGLGLLEAGAGRQGTAGGGRSGQRAAAVTVQRTEPRQPCETSMAASSKATATDPHRRYTSRSVEGAAALPYVSMAADAMPCMLGCRRGPMPI